LGIEWRRIEWLKLVSMSLSPQAIALSVPLLKLCDRTRRNHLLATVDQLVQIQVFAQLQPSELEGLQPYSRVQNYQTGEIVMQECDRIPAKLFALLNGSLRVSKTATTGKETILRTLTSGEIFAAPALLGNAIAPATVAAESNCQIITVEKDALLEAIRNNPEIALRMLMVFNQRLQQLHDTVHGLVSERAIVRLVRLIQYFANQYGTETKPEGLELKANLSYYQIARSIGITYEECVRLIKSIKSVLIYRRGGKITILDVG
jgi:CRP/FNR family transcriptional regulator, cyclic AMP receptor protein